MVKRHWCWTRDSYINDSIHDEKWIQENGFEVTKRRPGPNAKFDSFGEFIGEPEWSDNKIFITYKQHLDKENQTNFGEMNFEGKNTVTFITTPSFNVRINDLIIIPWEYDPYTTSEVDEVYKVKKMLAKSFDYFLPRSQTFIAERRFSSDDILADLED